MTAPKSTKKDARANYAGEPFDAEARETHNLCGTCRSEDKTDVRLARKAMKEKGPNIPWQKVKKDLGL